MTDEQTTPQTTSPKEDNASSADKADKQQTSKKASAKSKAPSLEEQLQDKQAELEELRTQMLRQVATERNEKEAFIARAKKETEISRRYAIQDVATNLLSIADDLERALKEMQKREDKESVTGISLVLKNLQDIFGKHEIKRVDTKVGSSFDPYYHEAILMQESDEHPKNTIMEIAQHGYTLADRVLRPTRVVVSKAPEAASKDKDKTEQAQSTQTDS